MTALLNSKIQYVGSVEWAAVPAYPAAGAVAAGTLCTNTANSPALSNERCFVCTIAGTSLGTAPALTVAKGALTQEGATGVWWQECTGQPGVNGDITNSPVWGAALTVTIGQIIYDVTSGSLQIASTSHATGAGKPTFSATAGTITADNSVNLWTSLGLASAFGNFAAPHKRVLNADSATWQTVVPARIFIASDHAETQAVALTLGGGQGTAATPNQYISVSKLTVPPTDASITAGASAATTGAFGLAAGGNAYWNGVTFSCGGGGANIATLTIGANGTASSIGYFENCTFQMASTSAGAKIATAAGGNSPISVLLNPTFIFGNTSQGLQFGGNPCNIINATFAQSGSVPAVAFFSANNSLTYQITIRDTDLSAITGTLLSLASNNTPGIIQLENCKLAAGVAMTTGSFPGPGGFTFKLHNCDSGTKNYRFYEANYLGTLQQETTIVDSTNPSSDGTTPISWNIATTANTGFSQPFNTEYLPIAQWNGLTSGSHTATIQINSNVALTNADIWMELECLDTSGFPIGSAISSCVASPLATPTTYTTSTDTWGGSETNQQYMQVTFSPLLKGPIKVRIYVAKPSLTVYINPLIIVS